MRTSTIDHYFKPDPHYNKDQASWDNNFLRAWFPELPSLIIEQVLSYLERNQIRYALFRVPRLERVIFNHYYRKEVHLLLTPTKRPHSCTSDETKKPMIDIYTFSDILEFMFCHWRVAPELVKVIASGDFEEMMHLMTVFHRRFVMAPKLEINLEKHELQPKDLEYIFSIQNLHKLQTSSSTYKHCREAFASGISKHENLKELVILGHSIADWSDIKFGESLTHLDMSWYEATDLGTVSLPSNLSHLYWNQVGLKDEILRSLSFPPLLTTLMVTHNRLKSLNVSELPQTIETLDVSYNRITSFECDPMNPSWPPHLKSIFLNCNHLSDESLKQLMEIKWPPFLENLRLDSNEFTSLNNLQGLPESIKNLDLSYTDIRSFLVEHNSDGYLFFRFPASLVSLNMQACENLVYDVPGLDLLQCTGIPFQIRIQFPLGLEDLDLTECGIHGLGVFAFPPSIVTLYLGGNQIEDLDSYQLDEGQKPAIRWNDLKKLENLYLFVNQIYSLYEWLPPPSLKLLDLSSNGLDAMTPEAGLLFEGVHPNLDNLRVLILNENRIHTVFDDANLPKNLNTLGLRANRLTSFGFSDNIASHENLVDLDLTHNQIDQIYVIEENKKYNMNLKRLNLTKNQVKKFSMTTDEFYGVFEQLGLTVVKKKHNLKSEHLFR